MTNTFHPQQPRDPESYLNLTPQGRHKAVVQMFYNVLEEQRTDRDLGQLSNSELALYLWQMSRYLMLKT